MFRELKCGCIFSEVQGRVRTCQTHRPERASGDGGGAPFVKGGLLRLYPGNGEMPRAWAGGK